MKTTFTPITRAGKWAAGLSIAFIVLMGLKIVGLMPLPNPVIVALGFIGFVIGIVAIIKNKERSILVFLSIPVGLLIVFWTAAELIYPH